MKIDDLLFILDRDIHFKKYKTTDNEISFSISMDKPNLMICGEKTLDSALGIALEECKRFEKGPP